MFRLCTAKNGPEIRNYNQFENITIKFTLINIFTDSVNVSHLPNCMVTTFSWPSKNLCKGCLFNFEDYQALLSHVN